jgi:hypothetical protein
MNKSFLYNQQTNTSLQWKLEHYPIKDNSYNHRPLNNTKPYTHPNYKNTKQQTQTLENLQKTEQIFTTNDISSNYTQEPNSL